MEKKHNKERADYISTEKTAASEEEMIAALPGNAEIYDFSTIKSMENSPLAGKKICILGSSVAYGALSLRQAVGEYLAARFDAGLTKEAVSGTTLLDKDRESYVSRMLRHLDPTEKYDIFICQLSTNDASQGLPIGQVSSSLDENDFDRQTSIGAMEYIIAYAKRIWKCPVLFFTGSHYESESYGRMVSSLYRLRKKWGIIILDLWSDPSFNNISDDERTLYMHDSIHPTKAGYRCWWGPELERQLLEKLHLKESCD